MAKKAKWLEEGTNVDLLEVITEALEETDNTTKINRAKKAVDELLERQPSAEASISDLLTEAKTLITEAQSIYEEEEAELIEMDEDVEDEEVIEDEEDEEELEDDEEVDLDSLSVKELRAIAKEQGINIKGMKKADLIEALSEVEEEYGEEEEEEDLEDMTLAELKELADELGVAYPAKVRKPKLIALIEEAEEAEEAEEEVVEDEEEEELEDYEDMTLADLKAEARERGIRISKKHKRDQVIALLEADDAE